MARFGTRSDIFSMAHAVALGSILSGVDDHDNDP
jgi:hypothetical protein